MKKFELFRERVRRALRADDGFTLIEIVVAAGLALVVLWPISTVLLDTQQASTGTIQRADAIQAAEVGLRSMDQQLRNAYEVEAPTTSNSPSCAGNSSGGQPCCNTTITNGIETCNVVDVLTRTVNTSGTPTDYWVRFDCTLSGTIDRACWEYKCPAAYNTSSSSSCTSSSGNLISKTLVIDEVSNATSTSPVFAFCYPNTASTGSACASGASRPSSVTVTIDVPAAGKLSTSTQNGDPTSVQLTDTVYMQNLDSGYDT